ncbi:MAG TPA: sulfotransferase [Devosia sp.]|nr:sulfotransferase [Devosia sp.]
MAWRNGQDRQGSVTVSDSAAASIEKARAQGRQFIFIAGAEGSGTTVLLRLLSLPPGGVSLGGNFFKLPEAPAAKMLSGAFDMANRQLWDRKASFAVHAQGRERWHQAMAAILESEAFADASRLFFKRSFPFNMPRDQFAPDLWDVLDLWPDVRLIAIYRDPRAAAYSAFRRGFDTDIRRLAVVCSEQLTWLAAQIRAIGPERVSIIAYRDMVNAPLQTLASIAESCGIPQAHLKAAIDAEGLRTTTDSRWSRELSAEEVGWLNEFFDERRLRQWEILTGGR